MSQVDAKTVGNVVAGSAVAFGTAGVVAPGFLSRIYGVDEAGAFRWALRAWGTRTLTLGALALALDNDEERRTILTASAAMNAADAVIALFLGSGLSIRSRLMASATSATFAGVCAAVLNGAFD